MITKVKNTPEGIISGLEEAEEWTEVWKTG